MFPARTARSIWTIYGLEIEGDMSGRGLVHRRTNRSLVWVFLLVIATVICLLNSCSSSVDANAETGERPQRVESESSLEKSIGALKESELVESAVVQSPELKSVFSDRLAEDTWNYLSSNWATDNHLPWSWRSTVMDGGDYANTAEIGLYALSWLAAYDLQQPWTPTWEATEAEVDAVLEQLRAWQTGSQSDKLHGPNAYNSSVFYQWYWINWDPPVVGAGPENHLVPSIDNAWLAVSLITIREYANVHDHPIIAKKADDILADMDFRLWYDSDSHRFYWGDVEDPLGGFPADYYSNENRLINFVARAMGQLDEIEFQQSLNALEQPSGEYAGITVEKMAWDGSYFTYGAPALFIREMDTSYGSRTITPATEAQLAYAKDQKYDAWGLSDCFSVGNGGYVQQGSLPVAMPISPETEAGLVTPHASALALITPLSGQAIANMETIVSEFPCMYDPIYGFRDSVMVNKKSGDYGLCSDLFSALAQEWIFLALANYDNEFVWRYFYQDEGVRQAHVEMYGYFEANLPVIRP